MVRVANSIAELVGQTPIVKLNRLIDENSAEVYLKLEYFNPGSSVKDRIALAMIEDAEKRSIETRGYNHRTYKRKYRNWTGNDRGCKRI